MADLKTTAPGASSSGIDVRGIGRFVFWFIVMFFVAVFAIIIVVINPITAQNFIYFLQALQIFFVLVIIFCFYKLQDFRRKFLAGCHEIDHLFEEKNGQSHGHDNDGHNDHDAGHGHEEKEKAPTNIHEERFQRALKSANSHQREEWRIGLIELDKLLKDLLFKNGYEGDTIEELLNNAKEKGFKYFEDALLANRTKRYLIKDMARLPQKSEGQTYKSVATLYKLAIKELLH